MWRTFSAFLISLWTVHSLAAKPVRILYNAEVTQPNVYVWSRPGNNPEIYPTSEVKQGAIVKVVEERPDGWLAIQPPPESFSWINARFVKRIVPNEPMWVVVTHPDVDVPVLVGSEIRKESKPTIVNTRLKRGSQVRSIAPVLALEGENWLAIEPPPAELRFIQKQAVRRVGDETIAAKKKEGNRGGSTFIPPSDKKESTNAKPSTPPPAPPEPTISVAELQRLTPEQLHKKGKEAEQLGNLRTAVTYYREYGRKMQLVNDISRATQTFTYAQYLEDRIRKGTSNTKTTTTSNTKGTPAGWVTRVGMLTSAYRSIEYRPTYVLRAAQGGKWTYVIPGEGVSLRDYVNLDVEVMGTLRYKRDLRAYYLIARQVRRLK